MHSRQLSKRGFTIVELLIVIVIIAILAAITIVAYNGVQQRARFAKLQSGLSAVRVALEMYNAENGAYPVSGWRYSCELGMANFLSGPYAYAPNLPQAPCADGSSNHNDTWVYSSNGVGYKLVHIRPYDTSIAPVVPTELRDPVRYSASNPTWGYWTPDYTSI